MKKTKVKMKKIITFIIGIFLILFIIIFIVNKRYIVNIKDFFYEKMQGEPISEDGEINNKYFNISDDYENPKETLQGINEAIEYAGKNNIKYIKLKNGKYLIDGTNDSNLSDGIEVHVSNITLDLNGSIIKYIDNSKPSYNIIKLMGVENVTIKNGILIGDRVNHDYETIPGTHAYGCGVSINGSKNVEVSNLKIYDMIGDGIYIGNLWDSTQNEYNQSEDCKIINNEINNCRRLGVALIGGINIIIENNEIYNIDGALPKAGIDLEANTNEIIDNIQIRNNKIGSLGSNYAVIVSKNTRDVLIESNELYGGIQGLDGKTQIDIVENNITRKFIFQDKC